MKLDESKIYAEAKAAKISVYTLVKRYYNYCENKDKTICCKNCQNSVIVNFYGKKYQLRCKEIGISSDESAAIKENFSCNKHKKKAIQMVVRPT